MTKIGFSTGDLYKTHSPVQAFQELRKMGITSIELSSRLIRPDNYYHLLDEFLESSFEGVQYLSLHFPAIPDKWRYGKNKETEEVLKRAYHIHSNHPLDLVIVHPNVVDDFNVFKDLPYPVGFENMDWRKESYKTPEEMEKLLDENPKAKFVMDVNHIYTNDKSMALAEKFWKFENRLAEIHLSGFLELHDPLFETKQEEIIRAIKKTRAPIIIESVLRIEDVPKELEYVKAELQKQHGIVLN